MFLLQTLRRSRVAARWALLWFVASMAMAVFAPAIVSAAVPGEICTASDPSPSASAGGTAGLAMHHGVHCVLCFPGTAPASSDRTPGVVPFQSAALPDRGDTRVTWRTTGPTSARDPPLAVV